MPLTYQHLKSAQNSFSKSNQAFEGWLLATYLTGYTSTFCTDI